MASVYSMKSKEDNQEKKKELREKKKAEKEQKRQEIMRSKSWRNPDKFIKDEHDTSQSTIQQE